MSPALNPTFYQVIVRVFQGQDLPAMDKGVGFLSSDKIDAYIKTKFKSKKYKTNVVTQYIKKEKYEPANWN